MRLRSAGVLAWLVWSVVGSPAQTTPGAQLATYQSSVDDSQQPYALYLPKSFKADQKYPLVITLHEEDSNHRLNLRRVFGIPSRLGEPDAPNLRFFPEVPEVDFIVAAPFARGTMGYQGIAEKDVYDVLADVERRFPVDPDRVYLTGISMGAAGALRLALTRPDVWAAVAAVCPSPMGSLEELAGNALNLPIRLFHGDLDPLVPVESSRAWHRRLLNLGVPVEYIEYPGVRHNAWDQAYRNGAIFEWFARFKRNTAPDRVRFDTRTYRYAKAYWLRIDGLTPGQSSFVDVTRKSPNAIEAATQGVDGFTLNLPLSGTVPVAVTIDGATLRVKPAASLSFTRTASGWRAAPYLAPAKRPGAEGPIVEAVSGRQIYVYGSVATHGPEDLEARRRLAQSAATWSTVRQKLAFTPAVKVDTAVTAEDLDAADLILFGTSETNTLIARFAPKLPLALSSAAPDYGLLFIAPIGKHYALVNSGLPWWTGAEEAGRGGSVLAPPQFRLLSTFGDYILFKGSLANVVAEGRFDRNWKVPAEAAPKLLSTGTVLIR